MSTLEEEKKDSSPIDSPMAQKLRRQLPPHIYAVAAKNRKNRFFVPSKANMFAGIQYEYVMIDSGCNSFLLPFKNEVFELFSGTEFAWSIRFSTGTGGILSRTLNIKKIRPALGTMGTMALAGNEGLMEIPFLRFHLGSESVRAVLANHNNKLSQADVGKLNTFLSVMGNNEAPERNHVLLGQIYLDCVVSVQYEGFLLMGDGNHFPSREDFVLINNILIPLREDFPEFDDLEDDDHDGDEADCYEYEFMDELED